jgi:hypothetical protein
MEGFNVFQNKVQQIEEYDVLVVGGGTTGICAALAAARIGARTAIVEYYGFLGGNAACGLPWLAFHRYPEGDLVVKGIPLELVKRLQRSGGAGDFDTDPACGSVIWINPVLLKTLFAEMVEEEGIDTYLHSLAAGVLMEGEKAAGVYIQNKQGCQLLKAKNIIDCTDSGDIAVWSGARYEFGRRHDGKVQVSSYIHLLGGVNVERMIDYFAENPDQMRPHKFSEAVLGKHLQYIRNATSIVLGAFPELITQAKADGVAYDRDYLIGVANRRTSMLLVVSSRVENVNPNDVKNFSRAELTGLRQTPGILEFITKYMPGGKDAFVIGSGHQIGIRESRHILGDYYLTGADLMDGKEFEDAIATGAYHLDIHTPDHNGLAPTQQPPLYQIPYRSLLPRGIDNLLIAGRAISANHEAQASTRITPISMALGQAAGTAAALSAVKGVDPRNIHIGKLQERLRRDGAKIDL